MDGYKPAKVVVNSLQNAPCTADIDVFDSPAIWTPDRARLSDILFGVVVSQRHDEMSCLDASAPSLR